MQELSEHLGLSNSGFKISGNSINEVLCAAQEKLYPFRKLMACYTCAIMEIETKFRVLNEEFSLQHDRNPIEGIHTRLKSIRSISEKLSRKDLAFSAQAIEENINDVAGVRVICSFIDDVDMLAEALLKQDDIRLIARKDYIRFPKPNGYRSLHLIVEVPIFLASEKRPMRVEIQLRTMAMDFWASLEHQLKYKKQVENETELSDELRECAQMSAMLDMRMNRLHAHMEKEDGAADEPMEGGRGDEE